MLRLTNYGLLVGIIGITLGVAPALSQAEVAPVVVYIQSQDYQHPIKLWQYYRDYWFAQGPYVEAAAKDVFTQSFGAVTTCQSDDNAGRVLVWLRPKMVYNPQLQRYYGEITAMAYTHDGKLLGTYTGEAVHTGFLDVNTRGQLAEVYQNTLQDVVKHMQADETFKQAVNTVLDASAASPCKLTSLLPEPKIQFMSF